MTTEYPTESAVIVMSVVAVVSVIGLWMCCKGCLLLVGKWCGVGKDMNGVFSNKLYCPFHKKTAFFNGYFHYFLDRKMPFSKAPRSY